MKVCTFHILAVLLKETCCKKISWQLCTTNAHLFTSCSFLSLLQSDFCLHSLEFPRCHSTEAELPMAVCSYIQWFILSPQCYSKAAWRGGQCCPSWNTSSLVFWESTCHVSWPLLSCLCCFVFFSTSECLRFPGLNCWYWDFYLHSLQIISPVRYENPVCRFRHDFPPDSFQLHIPQGFWSSLCKVSI